VNDLEDRLRHDLKKLAQQAQPETIRPLRTPAPRRRNPAIRWLAPVAAAAAVAGVITAVTLARGTVGSQPTGTTTSCQPSSAKVPDGTPPYYVTLHEVAPNGLVVIHVTVRSSAFGAALCSLTIPTNISTRHLGRDAGPWLTSITTSADDRTFAITDDDGVYLLHLSANGLSARLRQVQIPAPSGHFFGASVSAASLSPDGRQLAVWAYVCSPPGYPACRYGIEIVSLPSGAISRIWVTPQRAASLGQEPQVQWVDGGRKLLFWDLYTPGPFGYRLLTVAGSGGNLLHDSQAIQTLSAQTTGLRFEGPNAFLSPGGGDLLAAVNWLGRQSGPDVGELAEYSVRSGHLIRVLWRTKPFTYDGVLCRIQSAGPAGLHLLVQCPAFGRLDNGRFTPLPGVPSAILPSGPHGTVPLAAILDQGDSAAW
jgi:hypothetical protein